VRENGVKPRQFGGSECHLVVAGRNRFQLALQNVLRPRRSCNQAWVSSEERIELGTNSYPPQGGRESGRLVDPVAAGIPTGIVCRGRTRGNDLRQIGLL